jgi:hypothetical protein
LLRGNKNESLTSYNSSIKDDRCHEFKEKRLIDLDKMFDRNITLLMSFPGSCNTWVRLLIESATGTYTGSIYSDPGLATLLPMEARCGLRMSVIKGHPENFSRCGPLYLCIDNGPQEIKKCRTGMIYEWKKFVFIARDPMRSIFAEVQREITLQHSGVVTEVDESVLEMWNTHSVRIANEIRIKWNDVIYPMMKLHSPSNFLLIHYEDLTNPSKQVRTLSLIPKFLKFPTSQERLECAFILSESTNIHRKSVLTWDKLMRNDSRLACQLWQNIEYFSRNLSYPNPWPNLRCFNGTHIPN